MTSKNLPGFSAETTLVRSSAPYQPVAWKAARATGELIPQGTACVCSDDGKICCCCNGTTCRCVNIP